MARPLQSTSTSAGRGGPDGGGAQALQDEKSRAMRAQGTFHQWLLELTPEDITRAIAASRGGTGVWRQIWDSAAAGGAMERGQPALLPPPPEQSPGHVTGSATSASAQAAASASVPVARPAATGGQAAAAAGSSGSLRLPEVDPLVSAYGGLRVVSARWPLAQGLAVLLEARAGAP